MPIEIPLRDPCPFCGNLDGSFKCAFVLRDRRVSAFVNPRQYERGALLVIPNRHVATLLDLNEDETAAIGNTTRLLARALERAFPLTGLSVFQNNGVSSGQTVPHYHVHLVPRYGSEPPAELYSDSTHEKWPIEQRLQIAELVQR